MPDPDYDSPTALKAFLDSRGFAMQKKFGQNFLVNRSARERLVALLGGRAGDSVWEVGPGLGSMTALLLDRGCAVTAFEIDRGFCEILTGLFGDRSGFNLVSGDVLRTWRSEAAGPGAPGYFFGNLPYNIAATLIGDLIEGGAVFDRAVVTVQKEVAQRMAAAPGSPDYSAFTVLVHSVYDATVAMTLKGGSFWPRPNVDSAAVLLERAPHPPRAEDGALFRSLVRALFASRRKTVKNNLEAWLRSQARFAQDPQGLAASVLREAGVEASRRGESLPLEAFVALSDALWRYGSKE